VSQKMRGQQSQELAAPFGEQVEARSDGPASSPASPTFRAPPGLSEPQVHLPSRGSLQHSSGNCSPCVWNWKPQGCLRGRECGYCHLCPEGEIKARKKAKLATLRSGSSDKMGSEEDVSTTSPSDPNSPATQPVLAKAGSMDSDYESDSKKAAQPEVADKKEPGGEVAQAQSGTVEHRQSTVVASVVVSAAALLFA